MQTITSLNELRVNTESIKKTQEVLFDIVVGKLKKHTTTTRKNILNKILMLA